MDMILPMGAVEVKSEKQDRIFDNPEYVFEVKWDGIRHVFYHDDHVSNSLYGRSTNIAGAFLDKSERFQHLRGLKFPGFGDTVFDGETIAPAYLMHDRLAAFKYVSGINNSKIELANRMQEKSGFCRYMAFDLLRYQGKDITKWSLKDRRGMLEEVFGLIDRQEWNYAEDGTKIFMLTPQFPPSRAIFDKAVNAGDEGIMAKLLSSEYFPGKAPAWVWIKMKPVKYDEVIVTGFKDAKEGKTGQFKGLVGSLEVSQYIYPFNDPFSKEMMLIPVGFVSGFSVPMRKEITKHKDKWLGKVIEIEYDERYPDTGSFRFMRFYRERPDKMPKDCVWRKDDEDGNS